MPSPSETMMEMPPEGAIWATAYKGSWGRVDWLDEHDHSCIAVDGQVLDQGNYIYQWSLIVHFVAPIFVIPLIHGILKDAQVDILLLDKAWKVGEVINGWRSIWRNGLTLCENSNSMVHLFDGEPWKRQTLWSIWCDGKPWKRIQLMVHSMVIGLFLWWSFFNLM